MKKLNDRNKASSVSCFDFSTLYTKIPHSKLVKVLHELVDFCFKGGNAEFIAVNQYRAYWTNQKKSSDAFTFSKASLKNAIKYLLDNCYFKLGNKIFKQVIGIPMGSDPLHFLQHFFSIIMRTNGFEKLRSLIHVELENLLKCFALLMTCWL